MNTIYNNLAVQISEDLLAELEDLDPAEQAITAWLLKKAKYHDEKRIPINELSIITEMLKLDLERDSDFFKNQQNIELTKVPSGIKSYPNCQKIPLSTDYLPLDYSIHDVLTARASRRNYSREALTLRELSTLLHYSNGIRGRSSAYNNKNFPVRFAPSSGGLQSVEIYLAVNAVENLDKGLYHYNPDNNCLEILEKGIFRRKVIQCSLFLEWLDAASVIIFLTSDINRLFWKYGRRAYRWVHVDAGIVAENLHCLATALELPSCMVAGYIDDAINDLLQIDGSNEFIVLLTAIGGKPSH